MRNPSWGGKREGAGKPRQRFTLDQEHARYLRELVKVRSNGAPRRLTLDEVLADLVFSAYIDEIRGGMLGD